VETEVKVKEAAGLEADGEEMEMQVMSEMKADVILEVGGAKVETEAF
jgi:hypothetical protein